MQIRYEITPSDHLEMLKVKFGVSAKLTNLLLDIAGICFGMFAYYFFGGGLFVVIILFVTLALVLSSSYFCRTSFIENSTIGIEVSSKCAR